MKRLEIYCPCYVKSLNLFVLMFLLIDGQKHKQKELAEKLDVSIRTISRYLLDLEYIGFHIVVKVGRCGGCLLSGDSLRAFVERLSLHYPNFTGNRIDPLAG